MSNYQGFIKNIEALTKAKKEAQHNHKLITGRDYP